jgi:hypothetical protein
LYHMTTPISASPLAMLSKALSSLRSSELGSTFFHQSSMP